MIRSTNAFFMPFSGPSIPRIRHSSVDSYKNLVNVLKLLRIFGAWRAQNSRALGQRSLHTLHNGRAAAVGRV